MKIKLKTLSMALVLPLAISALTSCGDDDDKVDANLASMEGDPFVYVQYSDGSDRVIDSRNTTLHMEFNRITRRAAFDFSNIGLGEGAPLNFSFTDVDYSLGSDGISYSVSNPEIYAKGDLSGKKLGLYILYSGVKTINDDECVGIGARVTIEDEKDITLIPRELEWEGVTETSMTNTEQPAFVSYETTYEIDINPATSTADITVHKPKFSSDMPTLGDMVFPNIPVKFHPGGFTLEVDELVPMIDNTPQPKRIINNLKAECNLLSPESTLEFDCMKVFRVYAKVASNFAD